MASKDPRPPQDPQVRADDANDAAARAEDVTQAQISRQLRQIYEAVQGEGIPDRFLELLQKLDEAEKAQRGGDDE
ncbi:NepR family anti-sigma factor [Breoghania sp.]|uniref:NepR family anti-sigma factor n=1 Tax=Breoghania sp. TaxID=2065378 RepID=UPI002AA770AD|nr:NepR family anti-sigma factor [Breoghania sp.]